VAVSQQRGSAKETDRMGRRHGRVATLSSTRRARDRLVPPPQGSDDRHGLGTRADHLADNDEDS